MNLSGMIHPDSHRSKINAVKIAQKWTAIMPALLGTIWTVSRQWVTLNRKFSDDGSTLSS